MITPEELAEQFIEAAIDHAPEPLRRLGGLLTEVLDADDFNAAEPLLLGIACEVATLTAKAASVQAEADESWRDLHAVIDCPACDGSGDSGTGIKDLMGIRDSHTCETCGGDGLSSLKRTAARLATAEAHAEALAGALRQLLAGVSENHRVDCACCNCTARAALAAYRQKGDK